MPARGAAGGVLEVRVLGPLDVSVGGRAVELTSPKLRTLVAVLAMEAGSPVSVDRLAAALWDEDLPEHLRRSVQTNLTRLRGVLGPGLIVTGSAGYQLAVDPEHVDALRFVRLLDTAARAPDAVTTRARLAAAFALWRGSPFEDVRSGWLAGTRARLVERYLAAVERRIDLDLAEGRHADLVGHLQELTASHPLRESLWVRLLTALDRSGRQAEALAWYESVRQRLADELGADPGPDLRQIHADLLSVRPPHARPPGAGDAPAPPSGVAPVPRQLPADVDGFIGREAALKALHALAGDADRPATTAVVISAIAGMAGIGKTALAVHWAHRTAHQFPDGQLYVNLRGFHPSGQAMAPAEAIRGFLDALGVPAARIPADPHAQVGLYRSLLAGRRMLVVLDNASEPDQVRPLLPGSPTCVVLVTSRNRLTGLVATEAARPLILDPLPADEARDLLAARLGSDRIAAEPRATDAIIARCAGLPLALAVTAARAATPAVPLQTVATQLDDEQSRLDALAAGDPAADARVVFSWSYRTLSAPAARLFRLLGLHPGPDLATAAAASLAGVTPAAARPLLAELCGAHLLTEPVPGRYTFHDLLRTYATELARAHDDDADRRAALHRLLDHYLHTANTAALRIDPHREPVAIAPAQPGATPEDLPDYEHALAWCGAEHRVLLTAVTHAAATGFDTHAWQLAWAMSEFLYRRGYWYDWQTSYVTALAAARRLRDRRGQAIAHRGVAMACSNLGRHAQAQPHFRQALDLFGRLGDRVGQAHTHLNLAALLARQDRYAEALHHCQPALDLYVAAGARRGEAMALNTLGFLHAELGDHERALAHCQRAAVLFRTLGDRSGLASTWDSLGYVHRRRGRHRDAIRYYRRAAALFEELSNRFFQAETLVNLGDAYLGAGEPDAARAAWLQARDMFDESGHPRADQVRARLEALPSG
jgi:DNA-binding SARP family transcriptional activator/tetratricopeptide (TPR) repeat protein